MRLSITTWTAILTWSLTAAVVCTSPFVGGSDAAAQQRPVIERIRPASGPPGTQVSVLGRNLGYQSRVFLGEIELQILERLPNRWTVQIPAGARSGNLVIRTATGNYAGPSFRVTAAPAAPQISRVEPSSAPPGAEVTLVGENFSARIAENIVFLGDRPVIVRTATPTTLGVIVPTGAQSGSFVVRVSQAGEAQSPPFTVSVGTSITRIEPPAGPPGSQITIHGTGFGEGRRGIQVFLDNARLRVRSATSTEIVAQLPRRASSGRILVDVRNGGRAESPQVFVIQDRPSVSSVEPNSGSAGTQVTVRGSEFGRDLRAVRVTVDGHPFIVRSVAPDEIIATVPNDAHTGTLRVEVNGVAHDHGEFQILAPLRVDSFSPTSGGAGTVVILRGQGFAPRASDNHVFLGNVEQPVIAATTTELRVRLAAAPSAQFEVRTPGAAGRSRSPFIVQSTPFIASFTPHFGPVGETVTILGSNFGNSARLIRAEIGGTPMQVVSASDERIDVRVPAGARSARISITVGTQGGAVTPEDFVIEARRAVSALTPSQAFPGSEVTIRGENFPQRVNVQFQGAPPVAARRISRVEIRAIVPPTAQTGPVHVLLPNSRVMDAGQLSVVAAPSGLAVQTIEPQCAYTGCRAVLRGHGFSSVARHNRVRFNGRGVRVVSATAAELTIVLPAAGNGRFQVDVRGAGETQSPPFLILERR